MKSRMRGFFSYLGALGAVGFVACATFGGEEGSSSSSSSGSSGPSSNDGGPVVSAMPGTLKVTFASPVRLVAGASVKVHVKLDRGTIPGIVSIVGKNLPDGVGVVQLDLPEGVSEGDLELNATAAAKQGDAKGATVVARATTSSTTADSAMGLFVRGAPGSPDTTYAPNGTLDLGEVGYATRAAANDTHLYVLAGTVLRRYAVTGVHDAAFPDTTVTDLRDMRVHTDGSVFIVSSARTITKILPNGTRDANYGVGGEAGPFGSFMAKFPGMGLAANGQVFFTYSLSPSQATELIRLTASGAEDPTFSYTPYGARTGISALFGNADGTTIAAIGSFDGPATFQRIAATGASTEVKATPAADNLYLADAVRGKNEFYALHLPETYIDRAIMRFDQTLARDYSFGINGFAKLPPYVDGGGAGIGFVADGQNRVVAVCSTRIAGNNQLVISRFQVDGKPDTTFAPSGFHTSPSPKSDYLFVRVADAERIVVSGLAGTHAFIARFWM